MSKYDAEDNFDSFKRSLKSSDSGYAEDCWMIFKMAIEFGIIYTIDLEEELPQLPFDVSIRQGYMIRQTLFDSALQLKKEVDNEI